MVPFCRSLGAACGLRVHAAVVFSDHHSLQPPLRDVFRIVYVVADTMHVACCIVSKGGSELLFFCVLRWDGACLRHAACRASSSMRRACRCWLLLLHLLCCIVSAARCIARVIRCRRQGATARRARVQGDGGVLRMVNGNATFESVAISDTTAERVRVARRGRSGRRRSGAAVCRKVAWWRYLADPSSSRAAASHALRRRCAILVAASCACCMSTLHGVRRTLHGV